MAVDTNDQRWCSDNFEFRCDNGEPVRATFALDCCDHEAMMAAAGTQIGDIVRDAMLVAVEQRFERALLGASIELVTDSGSPGIAQRTRSFAFGIRLRPLTTPVYSTQSNGMGEASVKTMKMT